MGKLSKSLTNDIECGFAADCEISRPATPIEQWRLSSLQPLPPALGPPLALREERLQLVVAVPPLLQLGDGEFLGGGRWRFYSLFHTENGANFTICAQN